jgi:hypothetical protein
VSSNGTENRRNGPGTARWQIGRTQVVAALRSSGAFNSQARFCGDIVLMFYDDRVGDARSGAKSFAPRLPAAAIRHAPDPEVRGQGYRLCWNAFSLPKCSPKERS